MKRVFLFIAMAGMAILVAAPAIAQGPGGGGECQQGEFQRRGSGGPGQGFGGPGEGSQRPGGRQGGRGGLGGHHQGGPSRFIEKMLEGETAEKLGLEPEQIKTLEEGLQRIQKQEEVLREKLQTAGKAQAELLQAEGEVDEKALMKAIEKTGKIRTQMAKLRIRPILLVKKTLTEEQLQTSRKMMHERMQKRREEWGRQRGQGQGEGPGTCDKDRGARRKGKQAQTEAGEPDEE